MAVSLLGVDGTVDDVVDADASAGYSHGSVSRILFRHWNATVTITIAKT
ncbi:MAG: hypothetical protein JNJ94_14860 [Chlorobi bacterium]|nr:hypothetical protein [Chlorobiota bacterium]